MQSILAGRKRKERGMNDRNKQTTTNPFPSWAACRPSVASCTPHDRGSVVHTQVALSYRHRPVVMVTLPQLRLIMLTLINRIEFHRKYTNRIEIYYKYEPNPKEGHRVHGLPESIANVFLKASRKPTGPLVTHFSHAT